VGEVLDLPYQTIVREYRGTKRVAQELAAIDAERLAERGWQVQSSELTARSEGGCAWSLLQLLLFRYWFYDETRYVLTVTYALVPEEPQPAQE
jgi:hypothetical protein